ncbi:MAG: DUF3837 family protein [Lachnospiraceae bacterium]|nr:DUF3837 family protein [Lachnospiraceae bacterium]
MIYSIVYDAVRRKAATTPPNELIANTEMAASIALVLKEMNETMDFSEIKEPVEIKESFLKIIDQRENGLTENSKIFVERIKKYKVKKMVNETMEDLENLVKMKE